MEENPSRFSRKEATHEAPRVGPTRKSRDNVEDGEDLMECSGKYCKSCTAVLIADCVALCCCPCALVNLLALAFVKVPWMVGRKCLGLGKKKDKKVEIKRKSNKNDRDSTHETHDFVVDRDENLRKRGVDRRMLEIESGFGGEEHMEGGSARFEAERVWLELYQVGHLGFGRVSFTGIQSQGKGN